MIDLAVLDRGAAAGTNPRLGPVSLQRRSSNDKLSHVRRRRHRNGRFQTFPQPPYVASTYVSIEATCPNSCRFKGAGCYAQSGQAANAMQRLDAEAKRHALSGTEVNELEARLLDAQWSYYRKGVPQDGARGGRDLRLHVGGDTASNAGALALGGAADRFMSRGGGSVWTYTANWREIEPISFGPVSAYASVQTPEEATMAVDHGWTPAWTVRKLPQRRAFREPSSGIKIVPCPAQTSGMKCVRCRLCFRPLPKGTAVGFELHGRGMHQASRRLPVLGQTELPNVLS